LKMRAVAIATALRAVVRAYIPCPESKSRDVCLYGSVAWEPPVDQRPLISAIAACAADGRTPAPNLVHAPSGSIETKVPAELNTVKLMLTLTAKAVRRLFRVVDRDAPNAFTAASVRFRSAPSVGTTPGLRRGCYNESIDCRLAKIKGP
jgi:hypothetical protein